VSGAFSSEQFSSHGATLAPRLPCADFSRGAAAVRVRRFSPLFDSTLSPVPRHGRDEPTPQARPPIQAYPTALTGNRRLWKLHGRRVALCGCLQQWRRISDRLCASSCTLWFHCDRRGAIRDGPLSVPTSVGARVAILTFALPCEGEGRQISGSWILISLAPDSWPCMSGPQGRRGFAKLLKFAPSSLDGRRSEINIGNSLLVLAGGWNVSLRSR
jgi:hypothetical protein